MCKENQTFYFLYQEGAFENINNKWTMKDNDRPLEQIERQEVQNNDTMLGRYL